MYCIILNATVDFLKMPNGAVHFLKILADGDKPRSEGGKRISQRFNILWFIWKLLNYSVRV